MAIEDRAVAVNQGVVKSGINLDCISASWLATQLDEVGVVRLRDVFAPRWIDAMRETVTTRIAEHGDGDLLVGQPDQIVGSAAHQLINHPELRRLFDDVARLKRPDVSADSTTRCHLHIRNGFAPKAPSNLFHFDSSVLTMVVPIVIPEAAVGNCGELVAFGNKRPFRRFVASHLVDKILTHNSLYRRHLLMKVSETPEDYLVDIRPGDAYLFWGYRQLHGNLVCAPGLLRASLIVMFGDVHSDSPILNLAWRVSRSRRDLGRFQHSPKPLSDSAAS